jgi:hypothetical protein
MDLDRNVQSRNLLQSEDCHLGGQDFHLVLRPILGSDNDFLVLDSRLLDRQSKVLGDKDTKAKE